METDYRNLIVLNSIHELRNVKKLRPDKDKIVSYAGRECALDEARATEALENLMNKQLVFLKSIAAGKNRTSSTKVLVSITREMKYHGRHNVTEACMSMLRVPVVVMLCDYLCMICIVYVKLSR